MARVLRQQMIRVTKAVRPSLAAAWPCLGPFTSRGWNESLDAKSRKRSGMNVGDLNG